MFSVLLFVIFVDFVSSHFAINLSPFSDYLPIQDKQLKEMLQANRRYELYGSKGASANPPHPGAGMESGI